jgi:putative DNA primase/helicase
MVKDAFKTETHDVRADKVIAAIRNGRWKEYVEEIRREDDKDLVSKFKTCLPGVLFSGKFSERKNNALVQHSGLLCADLDKLNGELQNAREKLLGSPYLFAVFTSPSGGGLKAVFRVPADGAKHRGSFRAVEQHVKALTGVQIDKACKDPVRLCFVSYDPAAYHNQDATELQPLPEPEKPKCINNGELQPDIPLRERIASGLLGSLEWSEEKGGYFCQCPGEAYHTSGTGSKHTILYLDGAATIKCQHNSCLTVVETYNYRLRSEIGKAEREMDRADTSKAETPKEANEAKRPAKDGSELQGSAVICPATEPWPEAVDGAAVLDEVAKKVSSYLALPDGAADAIALWIMHAHTYEAFVHSPRLNFRSPMKGCGKTLALDVLAVLTPRSLRTESITPAVLFRLVEGQKPTLLLDETDTYLKEADELRGLLNAGHKRGAVALRCEGESNIVRAFKAFAPAALAGIRELPGTLHDRAIVIELVRAKPREVRERFDSRRTDEEMALRQKCARWAADNFGALKDCDPQLPETAFNRLADNWRPLFTIAQVMGSDWPKRASEAFAKLTSTFDLDAQGVSATLLADIAAIFGKEDTDKLPSAKLADSLVAIEGRPWAEWGRQRKPISPNQLANLLHPFGISPQVIRVGDETPRGYLLEQFLEQFDRYLPKHPLPDRNSATTLGKTPVSEVQHPHGVLHPENGHSTRECCGVAPCAGGPEVNREPEREDRLIEEAQRLFNAVPMGNPGSAFV